MDLKVRTRRVYPDSDPPKNNNTTSSLAILLCDF
jgi:hypothetical protein